MTIRQIVLPRSQSAATIRNAQLNGASLNDKEFNAIVFGNSFTLCGIDSEQLQNSCDLPDWETEVAMHALNGSFVCEWYWLAKLCYLSPSVKPDVIVLNVGKKSLRDRDVISHRRLALNFGMTNLPVIPMQDLGKNKKSLEFLLSRYSMLINRGRNIGEQVSMKLIPNFAEMQKLLIGRKKTQDLLKQNSVQPNRQEPIMPVSVNLAKRFFSECQSAGVDVIVVVMPHRSPYELDRSAKDLFEESKDWVTVIDHRDLTMLTKLDFKDEVHMTHSGRAKYTPIYVSDLRQHLLKTLDSAPSN